LPLFAFPFLAPFGDFGAFPDGVLDFAITTLPNLGPFPFASAPPLESLPPASSALINPNSFSS
jgi:hypothetical protein